MKKLGDFLIGILEFIVIIYAICIIAIMMNQNKYGYHEIDNRTYVVVTDENKNELGGFKKDDLVVIKKLNYDEVKVDDDVYYYATINNEYVILHGKLVEKMGDNRAATYSIDKVSSKISGDRMIGVYEKTYTGSGKLLKALTSSIGFLLLVILPVLLIFIYQVYNFILLLKEEK